MIILEASTTEETSAIATVQSTDEGSAIGDVDITFSIISNDCLNPSLTITYEEIDYANPTTEYFDVIDNDGTIIASCTGDQDQNCNTWETCIDGELLDVNTISAETSYTITLQTGSGFNDICNPTHDLAFNARVELTCAGTAMLIST